MPLQAAAAPLAGPLITAGAGLLGNAFGTLFGNRSRKRENERARAHDINMWDMTNAYNDPSQQMKRLQAAGLNPNLVYGGSSGQTAGTANSLPGAKSPQINDIQPGNQIMQYVNLKNTEAQTNNLRTQNGVLTAEKNLKNVQAITEAAKTSDLNVSAEYKSNLINKTLQDIKKSQSETQGSKLDNIYKFLENERAKNGMFKGDDYKKVILDKILQGYEDLKNGINPLPVKL